MNENLTTSRNGLDFIAKWEGCVLHVYKDIAGLPTIGVGHLIKPGESFTTITKEEALDLLAKDVSKCEAAIKKYIKVELNQNQFDALASWTFNCGTGVLQTSSLAAKLNQGDYGSVPESLKAWCKYSVVENGVKVMKTNQGLLNRRISEGQLWSKQVASVEPDATPEVQDGNGLLTQAQIDALNNVIIASVRKSLDNFMDDLDGRCEGDDACCHDESNS